MGSVLDTGGLRRHLFVYDAGERRRGRVGLAIGVAVERGIALLLGYALADGRCEAILMSLVVRVRLVPLPLRYHVRGGRA